MENEMKVSRESVLSYLDIAVGLYLDKGDEPGEWAVRDTEHRQHLAFGKIQFAYAFDLITVEEKYDYFRKIGLDYLI